MRQSDFDKAKEWLLKAKKQIPTDEMIAAALVDLNKYVLYNSNNTQGRMDNGSEVLIWSP